MSTHRRRIQRSAVGWPALPVAIATLDVGVAHINSDFDEAEAVLGPSTARGVEAFQTMLERFGGSLRVDP